MRRLPAAYGYGPVLLGVDPPVGPVRGARRVRLYAAGLGPGTPEVRFGRLQALEVSRPLPDLLVVTPPPSEPGETVDVHVVAAAGEALLRDGYTYRRALRIPEEFSTIAGAVAAASDGDLIEIGPGGVRGGADDREEAGGAARARGSRGDEDARLLLVRSRVTENRAFGSAAGAGAAAVDAAGHFADLDGLPRVLDGDGDGRRDLGDAIGLLRARA